LVGERFILKFTKTPIFLLCWCFGLYQRPKHQRQRSKKIGVLINFYIKEKKHAVIKCEMCTSICIFVNAPYTVLLSRLYLVLLLFIFIFYFFYYGIDHWSDAVIYSVT